MGEVLRWTILVVGVIAVTWAVLAVLAKTLPEGLTKQLASFIPQCATMVWRLWRDPRVPTRVRVVVLIAGLWVLSPVDLVPEFLPVIGPVDDVIVLALALRYAARTIDHEVLKQAWPGDPALLERVLLRRTRSTTQS